MAADGGPPEVVEVDLGGDLMAIVPVTLLADEAGTLPQGSQRERIPSTTQQVFSGNDRATRLASVVIAWNVFQHFYPTLFQFEAK
jgi:hypothetical protein